MDEQDESLQNAHTAFDRAGQEEHKLLKADGHDARARGLALMERLFALDPSQAGIVEDVERLEPVMDCTGFTADEAARTLLLWQEISSLREQGLSTVDIVQHLTKRLRGASVSSARGRGFPATEHVLCGRKQKFAGWSDADAHQQQALPGAAAAKQPKRGRFQQ
ncbi:hypothetical protein T492DRAFT_895135 [Pavlovales sp. CCMP2436]|nr:hypothetical protein T492DRAFT_895135 [Pavlovales sp. CCMP2436]|mmetsp:Transcript_25539/g.64892  ORF Transcript_25539/g.64892 Transcript_25539/m.64892 type:complete len:164 (+) Transcript_25539:86-577(+)